MTNAFIDRDWTNFSHLIYRIPNPHDQNAYVNRWRRRYASEFSEMRPESIFVWGIRTHKSLKEVFTSVCLYQESLVAKEANCWSSFFYLSYYSIFHALMSCVCLVPEESIESLSEISHNKLLNVFLSNFVNQKPCIVRADIDELFKMLKYLREYYSYKMPPNDFLYNHKDNIKPDEAIPYFIRNCLQLASLHSELIEAIARKNHRTNAITSEYSCRVREWYSILNCPRHPCTNEYLLHYTDEVKIGELKNHPGPVSFLTDLEHFTDEFRLYDGAKFPTFKDGTAINPSSFVYKTIHR